MSRVTSLTSMPEKQLNRLIMRLALLLVVGIVAFVAFYAVDRFRPPAAPIIDRELTALEAAVRADPADVAARGRLADVYMAAKRYDEAIAQFSAVLDTGKADKMAYVSRGRAYELKGDLAAAAADYTKVVEIASPGEKANVDPMLEIAYYGLGAIALQQDKLADAITNLNKALAIKRSDADAMNLLGAAYVKTGETDKAIEILRKAVAFVPTGWSEPYTNLAAAYTRAGQPELAEWAGAMALFQSGDAAGAETRLLALSSGKAAAEATVGLGLVTETRGDSGAAAEWYRKALAIDPTDVSAQLGLRRTSGGDTPASAAPSASPAAGGN
jgi:tetratricopeptide (TPR) repeat protein